MLPRSHTAAVVTARDRSRRVGETPERLATSLTVAGLDRDLVPWVEVLTVRSTGTMRGQSRFVLAAVDGAAADAVTHCAASLAVAMGLPVRCVRVEPGAGLRGEAQRSALARVLRGDQVDLQGRPEDLLARLIHLDDTAMAVLGIRRWETRASRRGSGTAVAVARRVSRPILLVPSTATEWAGPKRALVALDGTTDTAMAAAEAMAPLGRMGVESVPIHVTSTSTATGDAWTAEGRGVMRGVADSGCDMAVVAWTRQVRGRHGAAVLDVLSHTEVPVLLVPVL